MCSRLKEEFKVVECKVEVHYCEPEKGSILGENESDEDVEKIPFESLINFLEYHHMRIRLFIEAKGPIDFKFDNWCVDARIVVDNG